MATSTLERSTLEQLPQLSPEDEAWLASFDTAVPAFQSTIAQPDIGLDFSPAPAPFDVVKPKNKDSVPDLLSQGFSLFDLNTVTAPAPQSRQTSRGNNGESHPHRLRTAYGRRDLGRNLCRWAGFEPLSNKELEKVHAREAALRATPVNEQDLLGTKVNELITRMPEKVRNTGRTAVLATTLLSTVVAGTSVISSPEQHPTEVQLAADTLPELIFSHKQIEVDPSASQAVQALLRQTDEILFGDVSSTTPEETRAKPLLETIVKFADSGSKVTLTATPVPEIEPPVEITPTPMDVITTAPMAAPVETLETPDPVAGLGINIEFEGPEASTAITELVEQAQDQVDFQIISANENGVSLLVNSLVAEAETPTAPLPELEVPAGPLDSVNLEAIEAINGTDAQLIREVVAYLIEKQGLSLQGAAYLTGNLNKESNLNPNAPGGGLAQLQGARALNMPEGLYEQLDFLLNVEMDRDGGAAHLNELLRDPEGSVEAIKQGLKDWERWGIEGDRFAYGAQILEAIQTPMPEADPRLAHRLINPNIEQINGLETVLVEGIRVNIEIALNLANMLQAADEAGIDLSGGGFRTNERQIELRVAHGCGGSRIYKRSCTGSPPTAVPGRSMHEKGLAVDLKHNGALIQSRRNAAFQWLENNAERFGLYNLPSEPWHWSTNGN